MEDAFEKEIPLYEISISLYICAHLYFTSFFFFLFRALSEIGQVIVAWKKRSIYGRDLSSWSSIVRILLCIDRKLRSKIPQKLPNTPPFRNEQSYIRIYSRSRPIFCQTCRKISVYVGLFYAQRFSINCRC